MFVFIDESGIHKKEDKSSVALVYLKIKDVELVRQKIIDAEKDLKIKQFHWSKHKWEIRHSFIKAIIKESFIVKVAIIKNPFNKNKFEEALNSLLVERKIQKIIIDGKKPKWYSLRLKKVLRDKGVSVKKITTGDDDAFPCLRLADAFAGISRAYWDKRDDDRIRELYKLASKKIATQVLSGQITE